MPNGDDKHADIYNREWCQDKHRVVDKEIKAIKIHHEKDIDNVWNQIRRQNGMLWGVMSILIMNLGGIVVILLQGID